MGIRKRIDSIVDEIRNDKNLQYEMFKDLIVPLRSIKFVNEVQESDLSKKRKYSLITIAIVGECMRMAGYSLMGSVLYREFF